MIASVLSGGTPPEEWDIDWKYTDGPLENFGWQKKISGHAESKLEADGLHLRIISGGGYIQYICPVKTVKKAIYETEFEILKFDGSSSIPGGFRNLLSDGTKGNQVSIKRNAFYFDRSAAVLAQAEASRNYSMEMLFDASAGVKILVDGAAIFESEIFSTAYIIQNKIMQQFGGETVLKALRYKFIER